MLARMANKITSWRKIANAMWHAPDDPQIYGLLEVDATRLLDFVERARAAGHRLTATVLVGRAVAKTLEAVPDLNVRIVGDVAHPRASIDVFFIAAVEGGADLSGVKIERANEKSALEIARELRERATAMKSGNDPDLKRTKKSLRTLPIPVLRTALRVSSWIASDLERGIEALGLKPSPFGSAMVSSIGTLGLPVGFAPISWMYKVPLLVLAGSVADKPVAIDKRVEVRPIMPITATIDHRYADGWHVSRAMTAFRGYLDDPAAFEPPIEPA